MESETPQSFTMTPETFRKILRQKIEAICEERGIDFQTHKQKGTAFQLWTADLLRRAYRGVDTASDDAIFESHDLQLDVVLEDTVSEKLILAQCKCESLQSSPPPIDDALVDAFFSRHKLLLDREWVRKHGSSELFQVIGDYADRLAAGWSVDYYFVTTNASSPKTIAIADKHNAEYANSHLSIKCFLLGRQELKDFYLRTEPLEGGVGVDLDELLPQGMYFCRSSPYPTLVAAVRADWIRNLYNKGGARERIFALNIRDWLGRRTGINKRMGETIREDAENFFYYNNGISAICTGLNLIEEPHSVRVRAKTFQVINGAQTVGAIVDAPAKGDEAWVLLRITETSSAKSLRKQVNDNIIRFNNTQNLVKISDFCANDQIQKFLEEALAKHKAKPHLPQVTYQRRRGVSTRTRKGSILVRLEDLGKIRYAFKYDPTTVVNSPKDLFVRQSEHSEGAYERAFGIDGNDEVMWAQPEITECLLSIAFFIATERLIRESRAADSSLSYLSQLKYFFVSLAGEVRRKMYDDKRIAELVNSEKAFEREFDAFWRQGLYAIKAEWKHNERNDVPMTLRTFARSKKVWETVRETFKDLRSAGIAPGT